MKKIIQESRPEVAEYMSDFSGAKMGMDTPECQMEITFNYGSIYDGDTLRFDFNDEDAERLIRFLGENLHSKKVINVSEHLAKKIKAAQSKVDTLPSTTIGDRPRQLEGLAIWLQRNNQQSETISRAIDQLNQMASEWAALKSENDALKLQRRVWTVYVGSEEFKTFDEAVAQEWEKDGLEVTQAFVPVETPAMEAGSNNKK